MVAAGGGKRGEVGVHPEFRGRGVAGGKTFPADFDAGRFVGPADAGFGKKSRVQIPRGGIGQGRQVIKAHELSGGKEAEKGLLGGATK